jgi:hypothetical protein
MVHHRSHRRQYVIYSGYEMDVQTFFQFVSSLPHANLSKDTLNPTLAAVLVYQNWKFGLPRAVRKHVPEIRGWLNCPGPNI